MTRASESSRHRLRAIARRAMIARGLVPDFPPAVRAEMQGIHEAAVADPESVRDLRHLLWASIDNDDSLDLDQLTVADTTAKDGVKILVAIADVDALVKQHSATDGHAQTNTTSVYTAAEKFPMLPDRLSTDLTSLALGKARLANVVELLVNADGNVVASEFYSATVRNHAKLAYDSVAAWLDGQSEAPAGVSGNSGMEEQLRLQDRTAQAMKRLRHENGALTVGTLEARPVFDGDLLTDVRPEGKNRAKELIEDFMIAANTATARYLEHRGFPSLRRVLGAPKRWDRIVALAAGLGEQLPDQPNVVALEAFLVKRLRADPERFPDISLSVVKLLGSGEYVLERPGGGVEAHFGLAVRDYTHSTAPNRRYPDLMTQRLLKAALRGLPVPYGSDELAALAKHCTEQEDNAAKVERQVRKSAAALLLQSRVGERFDALVTGAATKGTWVRIGQPTVEGRVVRGFEGMDVGDHVRVELVGTDVDRGFIDFVRVGQ